MKKMTKTTTWTSNGNEMTVEAEIITEKSVYCDGDSATVPITPELRIRAKVKGHGVVGYGRPNHKTKNLPAGYVAAIGKVALKADRASEIEAMIAGLEATDVWQKHLTTKAKAEKAEAKYQAHRAKVNRAMNM